MVSESNQAALTFVEGPIEGVEIRPLKFFNDKRGWLVEFFRDDEVAEDRQPVMGYVSSTLPGVSRGPHEHVDQTDGFAFIGPSDFKLYLWDSRPDSPTYRNKLVSIVGTSNPTVVWIPPGVVHAYRNVGDVSGWVMNVPNRLYAGWGKKEPVDEIRHEEAVPNLYPLD